MVPFGLSDVVEFIFGGVQRPRSDFMQQGFPDVGQVGVDQRNAGFAAFTQSFAQAGRQLQAAGAAADNHNTMGHRYHSQGLKKNSVLESVGRAPCSS